MNSSIPPLVQGPLLYTANHATPSHGLHRDRIQARPAGSVPLSEHSLWDLESSPVQERERFRPISGTLQLGSPSPTMWKAFPKETVFILLPFVTNTGNYLAIRSPSRTGQPPVRFLNHAESTTFAPFPFPLPKTSRDTKEKKPRPFVWFLFFHRCVSKF